MKPAAPPLSPAATVAPHTPRAPRAATTALPRLALAALLCALCAAALPARLAAQAPQQGYAIAAEVPIDFRLLHAQADINKKDYVLSQSAPPIVYPLGENFYRLELKMKRNSRKSWRGEEAVKLHFYYDGLVLTFFGDRNRNERPDRYESSSEHLIRHKHEQITEGNRTFMRSVDLHIELGRGEVSAPSGLRRLQLHFIFL